MEVEIRLMDILDEANFPTRGRIAKIVSGTGLATDTVRKFLYNKTGVFHLDTIGAICTWLEEQGLEILSQVREVTGMPTVTEVLDPRHIEQVAEHADLLQVGSRNMQNYPLLKELGKIGKPVMLKRGFASTIEEWVRRSTN